MRRALALAARGQGRVEPNPMVGCVLVRAGRIVGEGYHRRYGGPHAEVEALRQAGAQARGATAYVTLEPCCHHGKTPPCTDALLAAGVKRVAAALRDPFPKVAGKGAQVLRSRGVSVAFGLLEAEARRLLAPYLKLQETGRPWVILKWAQSLDGKLATRKGDSQWISGEASRRRAHALRGRVDAIVVGVGTVVADDPELTCRHVRAKRVAARVVLDPKLRIPMQSRLVRTAGEVPTIVVTSEGSRPAQQALERAGVEVLRVRSRDGRLDLGQLLDVFGRRRFTNVMVEGGGVTLGAFWDAGLADETLVFVSPRLIGGADAPGALGGRGVGKMDEVRWPVERSIVASGEDVCYRLVWR